MSDPRDKIDDAMIDQAMALVQADNMEGICLECLSECGCVEPDAEKYECPECGEHAVYGAEQILLMGVA